MVVMKICVCLCFGLGPGCLAGGCYWWCILFVWAQALTVLLHLIILLLIALVLALPVHTGSCFFPEQMIDSSACGC